MITSTYWTSRLIDEPVNVDVAEPEKPWLCACPPPVFDAEMFKKLAMLTPGVFAQRCGNEPPNYLSMCRFL